MEPNRDAAAKMEEYLEMQHRRNLPTSMADVQSRYQAMPYGWREIGRTSISKRQVVSITKMKEVKEFLREYFDVMDVPDDEDGLIALHHQNRRYPYLLGRLSRRYGW